MKKLSDTEKWELLIKRDKSKKSGQPLEDSVSHDLGVAYMLETVQQLSSDSAADLLRSLPSDFFFKGYE